MLVYGRVFVHIREYLARVLHNPVHSAFAPENAPKPCGIIRRAFVSVAEAFYVAFFHSREMLIEFAIEIFAVAASHCNAEAEIDYADNARSEAIAENAA